MSFLQSNTLFYLKDILPITTIAGGTFRISGELETGNPIETGGLDTFIVLKNGTQIERMSVTMTGGIATIVKRGLQQDGVTENSALKKPWNDGTIAYITIKPKDLLGSGSTDIDFTFNGNVLFNKSIRYPVYADATARDLAIPTPTNGMWIYNTALGVNQQYIGGAWTNNASGSVVNADTATAGKVEIATQAEFDAGTDVGGTGATLVAPPSVVNSLKNLTTITKLAGESLTTGDAVRIETLQDYRIILGEQSGYVSLTNYVLHTEPLFGNVSGNTARSMMVIGNGVSSTQIKLGLRKVGTPTDNVTVRIETDNAGNPSGTLANANATASTSGVALNSAVQSMSEITLTFTGAFTLTNGVRYHIVISRSTGVDVSNHYAIGFYSIFTRAFMTNLYNGSTWGTSVGTNTMSVTFAGCHTSVITKTSASQISSCYYIGIVTANASIGGTVNMNPVNMISKALTGLTPDTAYYLSNTAGLISTTPGTVGARIGFSDRNGTSLQLGDGNSLDFAVASSYTLWTNNSAGISLYYVAKERLSVTATMSGGSSVYNRVIAKNGIDVINTTFTMVPGDTLIASSITGSTYPLITITVNNPVTKFISLL